MIGKFMSSMKSPPQTVSATKAAASEWQPNIEAVGSLRAVKGADLSPEVAGVVDSISFTSGDDVEQGAMLLKLRADDDVAKLKSLQATADLNADHLSARPETVPDPGGQPGHIRHRRGQSEKCQGTGRPTAGDPR